MNSRNLLFAAALLSLVLIGATQAQRTFNREGALDPAYGENGVAIPNTPVLNISLFDHANFTPDGLVYRMSTVTHNQRRTVVVIKYLANGQPDNSFGQNGTAIMETGTDYAGMGMAVLSDGKVLVVGFTGYVSVNQNNDFFVMRITATGALDQGFGSFGVATFNLPGSTPEMLTSDRANSILVQPDGKFIVGGISDEYLSGDSRSRTYAVLLRCLEDGNLDTSFGTGGISKVNIGANEPASTFLQESDLAFQKDGSFIFGAVVSRQNPGNGQYYDGAVVIRLGADGAPDNLFAGSGIAEITLPGVFTSKCLVRPISSGKILVLTFEGLVRLNANGFADPSFGEAGRVVFSSSGFPSGFNVGADGKIIVARADLENLPSGGQRYFARLERFWSNGMRDIKFGQSGRARVIIGSSYAPRQILVFENRIYMAASFGVPVTYYSPFVVRLFWSRKL